MKFKIGDKVKLVLFPKDLLARGIHTTSLEYIWLEGFVNGSDYSKPFIVTAYSITDGIIQLMGSALGQKCRLKWWVYTEAFDYHHGDWLEDLPLALSGDSNV
jgi:hypothetical protein